MKKIVVLRLIEIIIVMIIVSSLTYKIGHDRGVQYCAERLQRSPAYWEQFVQMEMDFLSAVVTRPNRLTSGTYVFEIRFPNQGLHTYLVDLIFDNGNLVKAPNPRQDTFVTYALIQNANVVSWGQTDTDEGPGATYVGLIDGQIMWGNVYIPSGTGWHQSPPSIGVWRLYPEDYEQEDYGQKELAPDFSGS